MNMSTDTTRRHFYSIHERIWHWLQAAGILALIFTGLAIHLPGLVPIVGFSTLLHLHDGVGFLLIVNAVLGLFYYLATGSIRHYLPRPQGFVESAARQIAYYGHGMFHGKPHPVEKLPERRLNPLQQIVYLIVLNVLLPLQMATGLALWAAARWHEPVETIVNLGVLGAIHTLGAWLFVSFLIVHIYLTTTGRTPLANLGAMVLGYENVEPTTTSDSTGNSGDTDHED